MTAICSPALSYPSFSVYLLSRLFFLSVILLHLNVSHQGVHPRPQKTSRHDHIGYAFSVCAPIPIQNVFRLVAITDLNTRCPE